ncbi:ATP-dependent DNA ligase [Mesorhizobium atlanticum]
MRKPVRLSFIRPMEPELVEQPPMGDGWSHEVKFDGYRTQIIKDEDGIRLHTKTGIDWTKKYRTIAGEAAGLNADSFIIEGEMIVTSDAGFSDFHALRSAITKRPQDLYLAAFDLLHLNGHDLRELPLSDRRDGAAGAYPLPAGISNSPKRCRAPAMPSTTLLAKRTWRASFRSGWMASTAPARP